MTKYDGRGNVLSVLDGDFNLTKFGYGAGGCKGNCFVAGCGGFNIGFYFGAPLATAADAPARRERDCSRRSAPIGREARQFESRPCAELLATRPPAG